MAYKFSLGTTVMSGALVPTDDDRYDIGSSNAQWKDGYFDGTLEADALTQGGVAVALSTVDLTAGNGLTGGGDLTSNRTFNVVGGDGITANANDIAITAAQTTITSVLNNSLKIGYGATDAYVSFATDNEINFAVDNAIQVVVDDGTFHPETNSDVDLGTSSKKFKDLYLAGTASIAGDLIVQGTTITLDVATVGITGSFSFEGSTANAHETVLGVVDPTADATINLPAMSAGTYYLPVLAAASTTAISATPEELNVLDGLAQGRILVGDGSGAASIVDASTDAQILIGNGTTLVSVAISGDASIDNTGAVTIANDAIESGMLNDNVISGQTELAHADINDADELMISDGGTLKKVGIDSLQNHYFAAISGDATVADGGALTIAANAVEGSMLNNNIVSGLDDINAAITGTDELIISDAGTIKRTDASRLKTYVAGLDVYQLSGSGDINGTISAESGSGFYYHHVNTSMDDGLGHESVYFVSGASWAAGTQLRIKAPEFATNGKISIYFQSSSAGDFIHSVDNNMADHSGSNLSQLGNEGAAPIVLESDFAAVTLVLWSVMTEGSTTQYDWAIM